MENNWNNYKIRQCYYKEALFFYQFSGSILLGHSRINHWSYGTWKLSPFWGRCPRVSKIPQHWYILSFNCFYTVTIVHPYHLTITRRTRISVKYLIQINKILKSMIIKLTAGLNQRSMDLHDFSTSKATIQWVIAEMH